MRCEGGSGEGGGWWRNTEWDGLGGEGTGGMGTVAFFGDEGDNWVTVRCGKCFSGDVVWCL